MVMMSFLYRHRVRSAQRLGATGLSLLTLLLLATGCGGDHSEEAPEAATSEDQTPAVQTALPNTAAYTDPAYDGQPVSEERYYRIVDVPIPDSILLEVGGMDAMSDGRLAVATRRGDVWIIDGAYGEGFEPTYTQFAHGLHEPLGLMQTADGDFLVSQRGEVTRLKDTDGDGRADAYEAVQVWPLSGNYHEYSYGPVPLPDGRLAFSLNLSWIGYGESLTPWRGWTMTYDPETGTVEPFAAGMRSPAGLGTNAEGDLFYAENQGDWIGSGRITHIEKGDFGGHPNSLAWASEPDSPIQLTKADVPSTGKPMHEMKDSIPGLKLPAVWFPHTLMGISTSAILSESAGGAFGPFGGDLFVADQGHSKIMRVALDKVNGEYQGAVFPFREGFESGILRTDWGTDGSMFVGMTSRGWASTGKEMYGLQRLVWTGETPFEMRNIRAQPDGFEITFTKPVDPEQAADPSRYDITGFTYHYHEEYGSDIIGRQDAPVQRATVLDDGRTVRLVVDSLREGYIHEIKLDSLRSRGGWPLLHNVAYYTLNQLPSEGGDAAGSEAQIAAQAPEGGQNAQAEADVQEADLQEAGVEETEAPTSQTAAAETAATQEEASEARGASPAKRITELPADWTSGPDTTITIGTEPGLKFDLASFQVKPGSRVKLTFVNDDDMLHNLVVTKKGQREAVANLAMNLGLDGPAQGYVPETGDVLFHTSLLQPETSEAIFFVAPVETGAYPYVCTFPGHAFTMYGTMEVEGEPTLP